MRLNIKALALSCGIVGGFFVCITTLLGHYYNYGLDFLVVVRSLYPGYSISPLGSALGFLYGYVSGALCAVVVGIFYNLLVGKKQ